MVYFFSFYPLHSYEVVTTRRGRHSVFECNDSNRFYDAIKTHGYIQLIIASRFNIFNDQSFGL